MSWVEGGDLGKANSHFPNNYWSLRLSKLVLEAIPKWKVRGASRDPGKKKSKYVYTQPISLV